MERSVDVQIMQTIAEFNYLVKEGETLSIDEVKLRARGSGIILNSNRMKASDKTNPALLIDPEQYYEVDYTIDQSGKRHEGMQMVKGSDLTEPQIKAIIDKVKLNNLLMRMGEEEDEYLMNLTLRNPPEAICPRCSYHIIHIDEHGINYGLCLPCHTSNA